MSRQNTRIESEGAEFLVLGQLLIVGIPTYKSYTNTPGYDLVAADPASNTSARISVKSRWRTDANGFLIKNFDCDFVVVVKLNRGAPRNGRETRRKPQEVRSPDFYVMPVADVRKMPRSTGWGLVRFKRITDLEQYRDRWDLVKEFLSTVKAAWH